MFSMFQLFSVSKPIKENVWTLNALTEKSQYYEIAKASVVLIFEDQRSYELVEVETWIEISNHKKVNHDKDVLEHTFLENSFQGFENKIYEISLFAHPTFDFYGKIMSHDNHLISWQSPCYMRLSFQ